MSKIKQRILKFLSHQDYPVNAKQVAEACNITVEMAEFYLSQLVKKQKARHKRISQITSGWEVDFAYKELHLEELQ